MAGPAFGTHLFLGSAGEYVFDYAAPVAFRMALAH